MGQTSSHSNSHLTQSRPPLITARDLFLIEISRPDNHIVIFNLLQHSGNQANIVLKIGVHDSRIGPFSQ